MTAILSQIALACSVCLNVHSLPAPSPQAAPERGCAKIEYEYKQDLNRPLGVLRGDNNLVYPGRLDAAGNFIEDRKQAPFLHPATPLLSGVDLGVLERLCRAYPVINEYKYKRKEKIHTPVYEYRSGKLIKGIFDVRNVFDLGGNFVPEAGSKVITLEEYLKTYDPEESPRIYNLPGRIVRKKTKDKQQDEK